MSICYDGQLEIDLERGVVYFHSFTTGTTVLRICGLEFPRSFGDGDTDAFDIIASDEKSSVMYNINRT